MQRGSNNIDPGKIYPTTGGTKSSESVCNKTKLQFCIEKDRKGLFFSRFRKPDSISAAFTAEQNSALGRCRPRELWTWKPETPPKPQPHWSRNFHYCIPIHLRNAISHVSVQIKTETCFYPPKLRGVIPIAKVLITISLSEAAKY